MEKIFNLDIKKVLLETNIKRGVDKYADIMQTFFLSNVSTNRDFQRKFNGFYRVRRNTDWQNIYYDIMERGKTGELNFENILRELYIKTGRVEASFASKLLHTLNNNMPIWDRYVLQNLGLKMPICNGEKKFEIAVYLYYKIVDWYDKALSTIEIQQKTVEFDETFPEYKWFSKTKKLDFLLWQIRD